MFEDLNFQLLLYIDIETTPIVKDYYSLPTEDYRHAWLYYCRQNKLIDINDERHEDVLNDLFKSKASLTPEFSQVICVSIGEYCLNENKVLEFKTWTRFLKNEEDNELLLLKDVHKYIDSRSNKELIAHNGKSFDYPFLIKRWIINGIKPPKQLQVFNKKPWEVNTYDTKEIWKFGGLNSASLLAICVSLNILSPKIGIDGSMIFGLFWETNDKYGSMMNIAKYCSNDVRALALIVQKLVAVDLNNITLPEIKYVQNNQ